ncbi:transcription factor TIP2-like [Phragmites australis]|uniref:transcription factor TIP2-like n=1 Tax=Phragmites australis TaxID=29695 RepID=UPI002D79056E|nr:transcription factor TIP2-like [Phragmites australis]XP_062183944.1 transcription factor TIP2-like [Phragmites australis]
MYHPHCELLMAHETMDLDASQPHLAASGVATTPAELSFQLFHSLDAAAAVSAVTPQPTVDYFFGCADHQPAVQFEQLVAPSAHHTMNMLRDYCNGQYTTAEPYLCGTRSGALVFGATDDESAAYMAGTFESSSPPRATGGRKRRRALGGGFHGGLANGVEKKEKQRRLRLTEKYTALMLLIPNRTKDDRATVISDAIEYIQELGRTVEELTLLVDKKRRRRELQGDVVDTAPAAVVAVGAKAESSEGEVAPPPAVQRQPIRSTYIQRKSKDTFVDVRIVEEEVNIKLTKRRRDGCLAAASRALDDLRLDLVHLSGGKIGDCQIYMFNTKIHPGSSVFASAVASRLIEVVDEY